MADQRKKRKTNCGLIGEDSSICLSSVRQRAVPGMVLGGGFTSGTERLSLGQMLSAFWCKNNAQPQSLACFIQSIVHTELLRDHFSRNFIHYFLPVAHYFPL